MHGVCARVQSYFRPCPLSTPRPFLDDDEEEARSQGARVELTAFFEQAGIWLGRITIGLMVITAIAWLTKQKWRFRAFGTTAFMVVLTSGVWTLAVVPSIVKPKVSGAARYEPVFDRNGARAVVVVKPTIDRKTLEATLRQAYIDLSSSGRNLKTGDTFTVVARTVVHPRPGVSRLLVLGTAQRTSLERGAEPKLSIDETAIAEATRLAAASAPR
jgi:hypothetical protein